MLYCFWDDAGTCVCPTSICGHASTLPRSNILIKNSLAKRKTDSIHFMTFILQVKKFKCEGIWVDCLSFSPSVYKHRGIGGGGEVGVLGQMTRYNSVLPDLQWVDETRGNLSSSEGETRDLRWFLGD